MARHFKDGEDPWSDARHVRASNGPDEPAPSRLSGAAWLLGAVAVGVAIALFLRAFVLGFYYVPSGSMLETIQEGDLVLGEKVSLMFEEPEQGDIVTFDSPIDGETLIKRVIAVGGQTIDLVDGFVYVDGELLEEDYTNGEESLSESDYEGSAGVTYPYTVPDGHVWVMGDHRTNSKDSRFFGPVDVDDVTSRAVLIYWPLWDVRAL